MNKENGKIKQLGLSYGKESIKGIALNLIFVGLFILLYYMNVSFSIYIIVVGICLLANYIFFSRYNIMMKKLINERNNDVLTLLSYFDIYIKNGYDVLTAFKLTNAFSSGYTKEKLGILISSINKDQSIIPFVKFSQNYSLKSIESMMNIIYQMKDISKVKNYYNDFKLLYVATLKEYNEEKIELNKKSLNSITCFPLIGTALILIILSMCIISIMGVAVNGI